MIRVFVIDEQPMIRHGVAAMLAETATMQWVGEACDGAQALLQAPALQPHVVLLDMGNAQAPGLDALAALKPALPLARFLVLAGASEPTAVRRALAAGAAGFLLKSATETELLQAIMSTHNGHAAIAPEVAQQLASGVEDPRTLIGSDLTQRERELLALMARGLSNQDISTQLAIAMPTVKFHVTNILSKLHADNRTEAVLVALRSKLVELQ